MSRLLLLNIFLIASFVFLKVADGTASCANIRCALPAYECKDCGICNSRCNEPERFCKLDCRHPKPGCGCSQGYVEDPRGNCVLRKNCPKKMY